MNSKALIETALKEACETFVFSGYQLAVDSLQGAVAWHGGMTSYLASRQEISSDTFFDLGSLTKVILTTSVIARLSDRGELDLESTLEDYFGEFKKSAYGKISLKKLLTHSTGLIAWYPFYKETQNSLIELFSTKEKSFFYSDQPIKTVYSDLGFLLMGEVLKKHFGDLTQLFHREVIEPLKMKGVVFGPLEPKNCAATEYCVERKKWVQGEVFDLNTASLGNVCSHAGLFSSAENLLPWAKEWLKAVHGESNWLSQSTAKAFTSPGQGLKESSWSLGWDTKSKAFSSAGNYFSGSSFGHLGFPGTSVWIDPEQKGIAILLTNRVHPSRVDERIKRFRPLIHDLIAKYWESYGA